MKKSTENPDLSRMMARYAELKNATAVGEEFGMSRYQVKRRWELLPEEERQRYEDQIAQKRAEALQEYAEASKNDVRDMVQRVVAVKNTLLAKLETCVECLPPKDPRSIGQIKDASAALKNLFSLEDEDPDKDKPNFWEKIIRQQRLQS